MSNYNSLKTTINANVKQNGNQEITGQILNSVLNQMVTTLGTGYQFAGVATTATNPGSPDAKVFYIANGKGTYTNFGGVEVTEDDVVVLYWDSSWHKVSTGIASQAKLSDLEDKIVKNDNVIEAIADTDVKQSKNLFDGGILGGYLRSSDYGLSVDASGKYIVTAPIKVKPDYYYYIKRSIINVAQERNLRCLVGADDATGKSALNINGTSSGISVDDKAIKIPSDCHYIQAQLVFGSVPETEDYKKLMLEEIGAEYDPNFEPSPYEPYGTTYNASVKEGAMPSSYADIKKDVNDLKEGIKEIIGERVIVSVPAQVTDRNVYLNASGVITSSSSGATICYFDVEEGQEYTLKVPTTGNVASIVWAYSNGDTKNATPPAIPVVGNSSPYEGTIKVNSNLGKIVVCYHKAEGTPTLEYEKREGGIEVKNTKTLKILCFGNSFAQDSMMYVPAILKKLCPDLELTIGVCVIGACSLARHLVNITNTASEAYSPTNYDYEYSKNGSAWANKSLSAEQCLAEEDWDVITFQQNGENAGRGVSAWESNIGVSLRGIQKAIHTMLRKPVKLGFILTHGSHDTDTANLKIRWQNTRDNVKKVEEETAFVEIFPYGTAIQNLRTTSLVNLGYGSAKNLLADQAHLQDGIGALCACYTSALKIMQIAGFSNIGIFGDGTNIDMEFITSNNILGTNPPRSTITDADILGMTDANRQLAQLAAIQAMRNPWEITDISAFE